MGEAVLATLRDRDFGFLWLAGLVSIAGDFALLVALPLHVYRLTGSTLSTAGTLASMFLPRILIGSVAGVFVDRWDRKRTMVVADLLRAGFLLPLLIAPVGHAMIYAVAATQATIGLFFSPAESALLPRLVGEDRLVTANALNALNDNLGFLTGPALGSATYAWSGIGGVAIIDAASYLGSALFISLIATDARPARIDHDRADGSAWARMIADWRDGLRVVRHDRTLSVLFAAWSLVEIAEGVFLTLALSPLVLDVLGGTPAQVGLLGTAQGVGGILAGLALARFGKRISKRWLLASGLAGLGLTDLAAFNARRFAGPGNSAVGVAMGWMALGGIPAVAGLTGRQSIVQVQTTDAFRGRVFGALSAVGGAATLVGLAIGGVLGESVSLVLILSISALVRVLGGVVAFAFLPRHERPVAGHGQADRLPGANTNE